jgi:hypothetical protein
MGLREGIKSGLQAFSEVDPGQAQIRAGERRLDLQQKAAMAGLVMEGVKAGTVPQEEAAQFLKNLGPQFEQLTLPGNAPPGELEAQGGGPPTPEQAESQRTTIIGPDEPDPLNTELIKLQTQRDTLTTMLQGASKTQATGINRQIGELDDRIAKITTITGRTEQDVLTKTQKGKAKLAADKGATDVGRIAQVLGELSDAPRAIGLPGKLSENLGGLLGQIPGAGPEMEEAFSQAVTGMGAEEGKRLRSAFIDTSAATLTAITGEESGRYTEAERNLFPSSAPIPVTA